MKPFVYSVTVNAGVAQVWKAFTDPSTIDAWGGGPAKMDDKVNTQFSLWGGDIHGTNTSVTPQKLLKQHWYSGSWKNPSKVSFVFSKIAADETKVELTHTDIPDDEYEDIADGWERYYLGPLKKLFEK